MGAASGSRSSCRRRSALVAAAATACFVAWLAASARERELGLLHASRSSSDSLLRAAQSAADCSRWQGTSLLGGGCLAELPPHVASFECCGGENYTCHSAGYACPAAALLPALRCVSPRHMLLRPTPGCSLGSSSAAKAAARTTVQSARLSVSLQQCRPSAEAVAGGSWVEVSGPLQPGVPSLQFQPACSPVSGSSQFWNRQPLAPQPPLAGPAALQRLWAAGFDRVVISGDSTVRHLYNRLVALIRQQDSVIDGGGIAHAHYRLQLRPGSGNTFTSSSSSSSSSSSGSSSGGSSGGTTQQSASASRGAASSARSLLSDAAAGGFAKDELWVSPPANFVKGDWDEGYMEEGLLHLLNRTFAAPSPGSSSRRGSSSSGGGGTPHGSSSSSSASSSSAGSSSSQLTVDFLVGAHARWQMRHMRRYLAELASTPGSEGSRVLAVLSLCVWEQKHVWPNGWLDFLKEVQRQVGQVVLLTCPTDRIRRDNQQEGRKVVAQRNRLLRELVAAERNGSAAEPAAGGVVVERQLQTGGGGGSSGSRPRASSGAAGSSGSNSDGGGSGGRLHASSEAAGSDGGDSGDSSSGSSKERRSGSNKGSGSSGGSSNKGSGSSGGSSNKGSGSDGSSSNKGGGSSSGSSSISAGSSRNSREEGTSQPPGRPLILVDIDGLTQDLPPGLAVAPLDYHYACMLANPNGYNSTGAMLFTGGDGRPQPAYQPMRYDRLLVPPAGRCDDPVNFASLQLMLSLLE